MNLYELSTEYQHLEEIITNGVENSEEMTQMLKKIEEIDANIEEKVKNGIGLIQSLNTLIDGMTNEIERLKQRKTILQKHRQQIKDWYQSNLMTLNRQKIVTDRGVMSIQKNPDSIEIIDESRIPQQYKRVIPSSEVIDRELIKSAIKSGKEVEGCKIADTTYHLRIR